MYHRAELFAHWVKRTDPMSRVFDWTKAQQSSCINYTKGGPLLKLSFTVGSAAGLPLVTDQMCRTDNNHCSNHWLGRIDWHDDLPGTTYTRATRTLNPNPYPN